MRALAVEWPEDCEGLVERFRIDLSDPELDNRVRLIDPYTFIGSTGSRQAEHYRIRVGARDADTATIISLTLALSLQDSGLDADYALIWDEPHSEADYPGEVCDWIESIY